jgi:hypothetical protein
MIKNKITWCYNAEYALRLTNDNTASSCCMMVGIENLTDRGKTLNQVFNKPILKDVRDKLNNGIRHPACKLCWQEEDAGRASKRIRDNERYLKELELGVSFQGITSLELNLGNTCNIKCRTCNPETSSFWIKEYHDVYLSDKISFKDYNKNLSVYHDFYSDDSDFWNDLEGHLVNLRQMVFYGGEPFLAKKMWKALEIAVEKGYSKNITLEYNTNGTTWPKETELWKYFKEVRVAFSVDGTHEKFNYTRFPAEWSVASENMLKIRELNKQYNNFYYTWCITLSPLNIFYVKEIVSEAYTNYKDYGLYLNLIHGPPHYNIQCIPNKFKSLIIDKLLSIPDSHQVSWYLKGIINFLETGTENQDVWNKFIETTKTHDRYRNQNFAEVFPEFAKIIGYSL